MAGKSPLPAKIRQAVLCDRAAGLTTIEIGKKYQLHRVTVSRICSKFKRMAPMSEMAATNKDYRHRLTSKSINALDAALDCDQDQYKRGGIAIQVLKGVGEFAGEKQTGIVINIGAANRLASRYMRIPLPEEEQEPDPQ